MDTKTFNKEGISFRYYDSGTGSIPLLFQHGIGGNLENVVSLFKFPSDIRVISMDVRGHGETTPVGDLSKFNLYTFVDDIVSLMDYLDLPKAILGGMSMGAALGMNAAVRYPNRLSGLILYRPAWFDSGMTAASIHLYQHFVDLIRGFGPTEGQKRFMELDIYKELQKKFPDTAKSIVSQFTAKKAVENVIRFEKLPYEKVVSHVSEISNIATPTLILSTKLDPVHPFEYGKALGSLIPNSQFIEITPKSINVEAHIAESEHALNSFIHKVEGVLI